VVRPASPIVAETIARAGFPAVALDAQHGLWDFAGLQSAIAAIRHGGAAPLVRTALGDFSGVSRVLDVAAEGVIAPLINTEADARALAAVAKYPPLGERSYGPMRAMALTGIADPKDYFFAANEETVAFAMIETRTGLDNAEAIAATPGIDGLFVGPVDLSIGISSGKSIDARSAEVERAIDRVIAAATKAGKIAGTYCFDGAHAEAYEKRGVRFFLIGSDAGFIGAGARAALGALKRT
jgi:4-hydroxy-2-oxoheptanedioate aldolase